jgi:hypothetical protein
MYFLYKIWLIVKHRPFIKCPFCGGIGGSIEGYYEREWSECHACYDEWRGLDDCNLSWFVGKTSLLNWIRSKLSIRSGLWYRAKLVTILRCKIGLHKFSEMGYDEKLCVYCYKVRDMVSLTNMKKKEGQNGNNRNN